MKFHYLSVTIPKALYAFNFKSKHFIFKNEIKKTYLTIFIYNFCSLFLQQKNEFLTLLQGKQYKTFLPVYKQFFLFYTQLYLYMFGMFRLKLQIVGSGYFFEQLTQNFVNIYLGYSHIFVLETYQDLVLKVLGRKQRILLLQSSDLFLLKKFSFLIKNLQKPDIYRGKGIRFLKERFVLKKGKKKFI